MIIDPLTYAGQVFPLRIGHQMTEQCEVLVSKENCMSGGSCS